MALPLRASLDGSGDDVLRVTAAERGRVEIAAGAGEGGRRLWTATYSVGGDVITPREAGPFGILSVGASRFSGDRCADVSLVLAGGEVGFFLVVLDGRDGSVEWSRRLLGKGGGGLATPVKVERRTHC